MAQKRKNKTAAEKQAIDYEQIGRMVANIYETGYIDRNKSYKMSFIKGVLGGLGGVVGATIVVTLLLWLLSLFQTVPFVDKLYENIEDTVNSQPR